MPCTADSHPHTPYKDQYIGPMSVCNSGSHGDTQNEVSYAVPLCRTILSFPFLRQWDYNIFAVGLLTKRGVSIFTKERNVTVIKLAFCIQLDRWPQWPRVFRFSSAIERPKLTQYIRCKLIGVSHLPSLYRNKLAKISCEKPWDVPQSCLPWIDWGSEPRKCGEGVNRSSNSHKMREKNTVLWQLPVFAWKFQLPQEPYFFKYVGLCLCLWYC